MIVGYTQSPDITVVTLRGELAARNVADLKAVVMKALDSSERVLIVFENISLLDRACIEVFCLAVRAAQELKKRLLFSGDKMEEFYRAASSCFYRELPPFHSLRLSPEQPCHPAACADRQGV